jgi:hypothetical protein
LATPTPPDVYALPPATTTESKTEEASPLETENERLSQTATTEFTEMAMGFDRYHRNRTFVATALFLFFGFI